MPKKKKNSKGKKGSKGGKNKKNKKKISKKGKKDKTIELPVVRVPPVRREKIIDYDKLMMDRCNKMLLTAETGICWKTVGDKKIMLFNPDAMDDTEVYKGSKSIFS